MTDKQKRFLIRTGRIVLIVTFWLTVWQVIAMIMDQPLFMPSVIQTFKTLGGLITTGVFWMSILMTLLRVLLGLVISFVIGVVLAFVSAHIRIIEQLLHPVVTAVKSTPVMSVVIIALVWFTAWTVPVFSCVLLCFPIFYANTLTGIKSVEKNYTELAKVFSIKRTRIVKEVTVPSVLPYVYSALSISLGFSWKSVVAAEVLTNLKHSMGYNLYITKFYLETEALFAWTIAIIIISLIVERGIKRLLPSKGSAL